MSSQVNFVLWQMRSLLLEYALGSLLSLKTTPPATNLPKGVPKEFLQLLAQACQRYGLDLPLAAAVAQVESGFDPSAVSPAGAKGVMQLMDSTARSLGVVDPFDPAQNIDAGVRLLAALLRQFGDEQLALAAYNAGPKAVLHSGGIPPIAETQKFVRAVLDYRERYSHNIWEV